VSLLNRSPGNRDIWLIDLGRAGTPSRFTDDPAAGFLPVWSPSDSQIACSSAPGGGASNIYVRPSDRSGPEERVLPSATPNYVTDWARDGLFLAYTDMVPATGSDLTSISTVKDLEAGLPETLFRTGNIYNGTNSMRHQYAVTRDGKQLLTIMPEQDAGSSFSTVVVNRLAARQKSP
jgi:hypothetical protein